MTLKEGLYGKRILFLSVSFFNYENIIATRLRELGADVYYFDERPSNSVFTKSIIRLYKNAYRLQINRYYRHILKSTETNNFDVLLVIKGEVIPEFFIKEIKRRNPNVKMIYYSFDSFNNNPNAKSILHLFDEKFTFDRKDAIEFKIHFRPLFYSADYGDIKLQKDSFKYETMFIGTVHSDRYYISESVRNWCTNNNLRSFAYYFFPSKFIFNFKRKIDRSFRYYDRNVINFKSLTHSEIIKLYRNSKAILDINHPNQSGLTMRTFEALGAGRKLITTNNEIQRYPFFNDNNVLIIDREDIQLRKDFFDKEFVEIPDAENSKMTLDGWLDCLFIKEQDQYWLNYGK